MTEKPQAMRLRTGQTLNIWHQQQRIEVCSTKPEPTTTNEQLELIDQINKCIPVDSVKDWTFTYTQWERQQ